MPVRCFLTACSALSATRLMMLFIIAAHVALLESFPFVDENHGQGFDRLVDVGEAT